MAFEKAEDKKPMAAQDEYEASKEKLNGLSARHLAAVGRVERARVELDDAEVDERKTREELDAENGRYVELEKKLAADHG